MKTVVVAFGRMNPPTVGHKKLVDKLKSIALQKHGSPFLYLSHSQDKKKNPLSYEQKLKYARKAFGSVVTKSVAKTLLQVMKELEGKGFTDAIIIAGSDRLAEFQSLLDKYNGKDFNMTSVKVVSAGERDPDADGVEGMSASKLRGLAQQGDLKTFISGVPLSATDGKRLFNDIRSGMDIKEEQEIEEHLLFEGINDPGIFKAVFLAGGPGSGKSFIVNKTALQSLGFKIVNSDDIFEKLLKNAGMASTPDNIFSNRGQEIRDTSKLLSSKKMNIYLNGRLGLVIDGTGKNYEKIAHQKQQLETLGYDTFMIFVNTNIETAIQRNKKRERILPDSVVHRMWNEVQDNMGKFQHLFKNQFLIVDNSEQANWKSEIQHAYKRMMSFVKNPVQNHLAKQWINSYQNRSKIKEEQEMNEVDFVELEEATRVLTLQQRQKRRLTMKRLGPRIARLRKIKLQRVAQKPALIKRARKAAIMLLKKRVAGEQGQNYSSLSPSQKIQIDRMVEKKLPMVEKIAKRLLPKIMKKELERIRSLRSGGSNDN
jgi:predicted kinase/nicotinic acid mononucleotide adenylyltransferase